MEKRFTQEQILRALKSNEVGMEVVDICCELDIDEQTFYRWHTKYSGMEVAEVKRTRAPEAENAKSEESSIESDLGEAAFSQEPLTNEESSSEHIDPEDAQNKSEDYAGAIADDDQATKLNPDNVDA